LQEYLLDHLEEAKLAFEFQEFDKTLKLLNHCSNVGQCRSFRLIAMEGNA
jgi:hypothetical protein